MRFCFKLQRLYDIYQKMRELITKILKKPLQKCCFKNNNMLH